MLKINNLKDGDIITVDDDGLMREGTVVRTSPAEHQALVDNGIQEFWYDQEDMHAVPLDENQLTRIEDGEVKKRFTLKLTPSDPGTAVALVDAPDRVQVVVKGRVQLEVMTAELADSNRVGLLAVGPEAGSWSAIAVWG